MEFCNGSIKCFCDGARWKFFWQPVVRLLLSKVSSTSFYFESCELAEIVGPFLLLASQNERHASKQSCLKIFLLRAFERYILVVKVKRPNCIALKILTYHWMFVRFLSKKLYHWAKSNPNSTYHRPMTLRHCSRALQMTKQDEPWKNWCKWWWQSKKKPSKESWNQVISARNWIKGFGSKSDFRRRIPSLSTTLPRTLRTVNWSVTPKTFRNLFKYWVERCFFLRPVISYLVKNNCPTV